MRNVDVEGAIDGVLQRACLSSAYMRDDWREILS